MSSSKCDKTSMVQLRKIGQLYNVKGRSKQVLCQRIELATGQTITKILAKHASTITGSADDNDDGIFDFLEPFNDDDDDEDTPVFEVDEEQLREHLDEMQTSGELELLSDIIWDEQTNKPLINAIIHSKDPKLATWRNKRGILYSMNDGRLFLLEHGQQRPLFIRIDKLPAQFLHLSELLS